MAKIVNMENPFHNGNTTKGRIPPDAYVIIIGAMKCGTTSLFSYLSEHPFICAAKVKEPEFFSEHQKHKIHFNRYADLWPDFDSVVHRYVMEASTGYTKYPWESCVPERIRDYGIKPKFIYIMRDPFDRIESHFNFNKGKKGWNLDICDKQLISVSNYYVQLEHFRRFFSKEDMLLLDFDDLSRNPAEILTKVFQFLDLPPHLPDQYGIKNPTLTIPWYFRRIIYRLNPYYPESVKGVSKKILMSWISQQKKYTLSDKERKYIQGTLQDDMKCLHFVYGVSVQKWGFKT